MDIQDLIAGQGPALMAKLQQAGLTGEQAQAFLPAAGQQLSGAASGPGLAGLLGEGGIEGLLAQLDVDALAARVGIDPGLAHKALQAIAPQIKASLEGGGAGALLGGLGSKFLGR